MSTAKVDGKTAIGTEINRRRARRPLAAVTGASKPANLMWLALVAQDRLVARYGIRRRALQMAIA
jgi:hypothetical protein